MPVADAQEPQPAPLPSLPDLDSIPRSLLHNCPNTKPHRFVRDKLRAPSVSDSFHFFDRCKYCGTRREQAIVKKMVDGKLTTEASTTIYYGTQHRTFTMEGKGRC